MFFPAKSSAATFAVFRDRIIGVGSYSAPHEIDIAGGYLCPGFVDAHVHIESSMVTPDIFSSVILPHGTTSIIADPHEIANVSGASGIQYMLDASGKLPLRVFFYDAVLCAVLSV